MTAATASVRLQQQGSNSPHLVRVGSSMAGGMRNSDAIALSEFLLSPLPPSPSLCVFSLRCDAPRVLPIHRTTAAAAGFQVHYHCRVPRGSRQARPFSLEVALSLRLYCGHSGQHALPARAHPTTNYSLNVPSLSLVDQIRLIAMANF